MCRFEEFVLSVSQRYNSLFIRHLHEVIRVANLKLVKMWTGSGIFGLGGSKLIQVSQMSQIINGLG